MTLEDHLKQSQFLSGTLSKTQIHTLLCSLASSIYVSSMAEELEGNFMLYLSEVAHGMHL